MGGRALKTIKTRSYEKDEFNILCFNINSLICNIFDRYYIFKSFKHKMIYNDMDILIQLKTDQNPLEIIKDIFNPSEIYHNGSCFSFDYKELQIDFIITSEENWETSIVYLKYGDLGNLMGRISKPLFGLKYGHDGLVFTIVDEDNNQTYGELVVSKIPKDIFEFLGFDWNKFCIGFNSMEDMFDYVKSSKYFNAKLFDFDELNHQNRTRNRKREGYCKFIEYVKDFPRNEIYKAKIKDALDYILQGFGISYHEEYSNTINNIRNKQIAKKRIVEIVRNSGYENKHLGEKMSMLNDWINDNIELICNKSSSELSSEVNKRIENENK